MRLEQLIRLECGVCGLPLKSQQVSDQAKLIRIFGVIRYGACPVCLSEQDPKDPEWIAELSAWMRQYGECPNCWGKLTWFCDSWKREHGKWISADGGWWVCTKCEKEVHHEPGETDPQAADPADGSQAG